MTDSVLTRDDLEAVLLAMLDDAPEALADEDNLMDLGLDSMRAMNLAMQWEEEGTPLDFADLAEAPTFGELWALLKDRQESAAS